MVCSVDIVVTVAAVGYIIAGVAVDDVVASIAVQHVVASLTGHGIVAFAAIDGVVASVAVQLIVASAAIDQIIAVTAKAGIVAIAAVNGVVAVTAADDVVASIAVNRVSAVAARDGVVADAAIDFIVAFASIDGVVAAQTVDQVVIAGIASQDRVIAVDQVAIGRIGIADAHGVVAFGAEHGAITQRGAATDFFDLGVVDVFASRHAIRVGEDHATREAVAIRVQHRRAGAIWASGDVDLAIVQHEDVVIIAACAAVDAVACAAIDGVAIIAAIDFVSARAAIQRVVASAAIQRVGAAFAIDDIVAKAAVQDVVATRHARAFDRSVKEDVGDVDTSVVARAQRLHLGVHDLDPGNRASDVDQRGIVAIRLSAAAAATGQQRFRAADAVQILHGDVAASRDIDRNAVAVHVIGIDLHFGCVVDVVDTEADVLNVIREAKVVRHLLAVFVQDRVERAVGVHSFSAGIDARDVFGLGLKRRRGVFVCGGLAERHGDIACILAKAALQVVAVVDGRAVAAWIGRLGPLKAFTHIGRPVRAVSAVAIDHIVASAAVDGIVACAAFDVVVAHAAFDLVVAVVAIDFVVAGAAIDLIVAGTAINFVIAGAAVDIVIARAAINRVVTCVAVNSIRISAAINGVVAVCACDHVAASIAVQRVIASTAINPVVTGATKGNIIARASVDGVVAAVAVDQIVIGLRAGRDGIVVVDAVALGVARVVGTDHVVASGTFDGAIKRHNICKGRVVDGLVGIPTGIIRTRDLGHFDVGDRQVIQRALVQQVGDKKVAVGLLDHHSFDLNDRSISQRDIQLGRHGAVGLVRDRAAAGVVRNRVVTAFVVRNDAVMLRVRQRGLHQRQIIRTLGHANKLARHLGIVVAFVQIDVGVIA